MITVRTSPTYVNRVRQDWTANGGVYGDGGVYAVVPSNDPFAQLGPTLDLTFAGVPTNQLTAATADGYSINLNLSSEIYQIAAQYTVWTATGLTQVNFADIVTFTRTGSTATYFNSAGVLTTAAADVPRFDFDPSTLAAQGLLIEEQRTNSIRNNTMQGAVAGTPGTPPTNWGVTGTANGLTRTISTGTENGITYIDVRYAGTTTAASFCLIRPEAINQVAAASGQSWTSSLYMRVAAGSTANITGFENWIIGADAGGVTTESTQATPAITGAMTRFAVSRTMNNASTAFVYPYVAFTFNNGAAIDITLRIGLPQLEQGAFATSVIPTTVAQVTRNADDARVNVLSPWYNQSAGTLFVERIQQPIDTISARRYINVCDGTTANSIQKYQATGGISAAVTAVGGIASFGPSPTGVPAQGSVVKTALSFDGISKSMCRDAGTVFTDAIASPTSGMTTMFIGSQLGTAGPAVQFSCTWIRRIVYYPRRLANADLQTITA